MTTKFSKQFVDEYSLFLLNWAKGKTGTVELAEELVQEVWVQFFHAAEIEEKRGNTIQKPENFLWKIAHYVWCNFLRSKKSSNGNNVSVNENEIQIAQANRVQSPDVETIFLTTSLQYSYLSSTVAKEFASYGRDISLFVPPEVIPLIHEKMRIDKEKQDYGK